MIVEEMVSVPISAHTAHFYEELGYQIPRTNNKRGKKVIKRGTVIMASTINLPSSSVIVNIECDYCKKVYKARYADYNKTVLNGVIKKACCLNCTSKKRDESNLKQYGVENQFQLKEVQIKSAKTCIDKYGFEYAILNKNIRKSSADAHRLPFDVVLKRFQDAGMTTLMKKDEYKNSSQKIPYICNSHPGVIRHTTLVNLWGLLGCPECWQDRRSGENHPNWEGGISNLSSYLRDKIKPWVRKSEKFYNYTCLITGKASNTIHHLYGFNMIRDEALFNLNLDIRPEINLYTEDELELITNEIIQLHNKYGLGVPLRDDVHELFHNLYGRGNNTPEQFEEFKIRYRVGEFDELLAS